jgi:predicted polyphosphate/ATP-dependent NAD kinase
MAEPRRIGLIVNPIAGIGGPLAARGSDLFESLEDAYGAGGLPVAQRRAERALVRLRRTAADVSILTVSGLMGADVATRSGFQPLVVADVAERTTARDTARAAQAMISHGADLLLFAGGDGTARDIFAVAGDRLPMVGIPTGVKMHSAVFAISPEAAGETAATSKACGARQAEIMDGDEANLSAGRLSASLFGYARTPDLPRLLQPAKGTGPDGGEAAITALGRTLAREIPPHHLVILGPGTTMRAVKRAFGLEGTLLGVDAVADGGIAALDADARRLEALCASRPEVDLLVGVVGNQGFIFGRGNQQISPAVIRAAGRIHIIATRDKLIALPRGLHVDSGDLALDRALAGYHRVRTGPRDSIMMRLPAT